MADDQKNFWTTIPGILTGLAAVIAATTGLIAAFHSHSGSQGGSTPTPAVVTQPAAPSNPTSGPTPASGGPAAYTGFWSGSAKNLKMAVLDLESNGPTISGTFQRPCASAGLFNISAVNVQGDNVTVTISGLSHAGKPMAPIEFDLKAQDGKLAGTYLQGKRREEITFTRGRQDCPAGATGTDSGT